MKKTSILSIISTVFVLGACDHYSTKLASMDSPQRAPYQDVSAIMPAAGGYFLDEMTFKDYLLNEYKQLANYEHGIRGDYQAAKYYTQKIEKLQQGQMVAPASFSDFKIGKVYRQDLKDARYDLVEAMQVFNIPENRYALAIAQSRYDCWMDQTEEHKEFSGCEMEFKQAMDSLVIPLDYYSDEDFYNDFFDIGV